MMLDGDAQAQDRSPLDRQHLAMLGRPDTDLPPRMRHDGIAAVDRCSTDERIAFRITFDGERLPVGYREQIADSQFKIVTTAIEHTRRHGLRGLLGVTRPQLSILIAMDAPDLARGAP